MNLRFDSNGWQAVVADQFTFSNLRLVTQAICNIIRQQQNYIDNFPPRLVVGYDSRFMGKHFAQVAAEIVAQNSLDVYICDRAAPTPAISWLIRDEVASGALVITGGHESAEYNGIKFITSHMAVADETMTDGIEGEIEALKSQGSPMTYSLNPGDKEAKNPKPAYFNCLGSRVDLAAIAQANLDIHVNYLNGIVSGYLQELLREHGGQVQESFNNPLADFGGWIPDLNPQNLDEFSQGLSQNQLGIIFDGDGSSVRFFQGATEIPPAQIAALIYNHLVTQKGLEGGLIKPSQNQDLSEKIAKRHQQAAILSKTADFREITPLMVHEDAVLAYDQLGGYAFQSHIMERDGILAALYVLETCAQAQKRPLELIQDLEQSVLV